jgi:hypothetical protein
LQSWWTLTKQLTTGFFKMKEVITTDLAAFGARERAMLVDLLSAWKDQGLPYDFDTYNVVPMFNTKSGCVFLTNEEYQAAMLNGDKLESWYYCPNCGHEGFKEDCQLNDAGCNHCEPVNTGR